MRHIYLGKSNKSDPRIWQPIRFEIIQRLGNEGLSEWIGVNNPGDIYNAAAFVFATDATHEFGIIGKGLNGQINTAFGNNVPVFVMDLSIPDFPATVDEMIEEIRFIPVTGQELLPDKERDFITTARFQYNRSEAITFSELMDIVAGKNVSKSANEDIDDDWL